MNIDFQDNTQNMDKEIIDLLERLLQFAAEKENINEEAEISINFVTNKEIQEINRDYRGKDTPTDVISFAMQESVEGELEIIDEDMDIPETLGDIIISIEKAKEQAEEYNHSYERELGFLAVHGLLHLLGYDHMNEQDEKKMFARQEEILGEFGLER
ncbi:MULTISPECIES: rRNA maturation RNase YbeY [Bacillaceae]|uniref:Endoribonuclease YbeY n=1 Tax=Oceanobacillus caeni TaxID=405946 RepID=A0ABR5MJU2_9BACI|nr:MULTISPECIES: rRNA maturation RNase YbeY [Bacillaceae]KKE80604.1 rRNA maturation factor [Bacilli bacterium VT-13-104]PZD87830.1 rRNA maturation RNase YbeY [Bacilli bacterium]KPH75877.1 rRNA maturation factor [Oceanobacillus caeni]MBU8789460.1 rRNA maturation RNase YbeY [Oceanobacillus caeni]MED4474572.1 rRNA maturation RNase YbeY [Oceanobacillus caeni]